MVIYINSRDQWHGLGMVWMVSLCATIISFAYIYTYSLKVRPEAIVIEIREKRSIDQTRSVKPLYNLRWELKI